MKRPEKQRGASTTDSRLPVSLTWTRFNPDQSSWGRQAKMIQFQGESQFEGTLRTPDKTRTNLVLMESTVKEETTDLKLVFTFYGFTDSSKINLIIFL